MSEPKRDPVYEDVASIKTDIGNIKETVTKCFEKLDDFCTQVTEHKEQITGLGTRIGDVEAVQKTWDQRVWGAVIAVLVAIIGFVTNKIWRG